MKRQLCLILALLVPLSVLFSAPASPESGGSILEAIAHKWYWGSALPTGQQAHHFVLVEAIPSETSITLSWEVSTAKDVAYFTLERADSGFGFGLMGGFRISNTNEQKFSFSDPSPLLKQRVNYRIKMVLTDGSTIFSEPVEVGPMVKFISSPGSYQEMVWIGFPNELLDQPAVELYDQMGNALQPSSVETVGPAKMEVGIRGLPEGLYFLRVTYAGKQWLHRFLK